MLPVYEDISSSIWVYAVHWVAGAVGIRADAVVLFGQWVDAVECGDDRVILAGLEVVEVETEITVLTLG